MKWKGVGDETGTDGQHSYKFDYDKSHKLKQASYQEKGTTGWSTNTGMKNEVMTYDQNGNIKTLQRAHESAGVAALMDDLTYTYAEGNQLSKVDDAAESDAGFRDTDTDETEYTYDDNGNVLSDKNKGMTSIVYNFLGKPQEITFSDGKVIHYTYDAAGNKLSVALTTGGTTTTTDYAGSFVYQDSELSFFASPEGRVVKKGTALEYQYAIADHQGNTRVVFTSALAQGIEHSADYETDNADFRDDDVSTSSLPVMNHTVGGTYSQLLNGGNNSQVGAARGFRVYPGDKVKAEVYAKYWEGTGPQGSLLDFAPALTAAFGLSESGPVEMLQAFQGLNDFGSLIASGDRPDDENAPKGFVTILLFDKHHNFLDAAWAQLEEGYTQTGIVNSDPFDHLEQEMTVTQEGFAYVFVSNEHPLQLDIHFDDFKVTHTPSNIVQYNEYYPFGLQTEDSWTREDATGNSFLYNAGSELNAQSGWYETFFRGYDASLGRFMQVDPLASVYSSQTGYQYAMNNPVLINDPMGDRVETLLPDYVDPSVYRNGYDRDPWYHTYDNAWMVTAGQMSLDEYVSKYSVATGTYVPVYTSDRSAYQNNPQTLEGTRLVKKLSGYNLVFLQRSSFDTQGGGPGGEYALNSAFTMRGDDVNYKTLFNEFLTGEGPEYSGFGANHPMTKDLKNSWIVGIAQAEFLKRNLNNIQNNKPLQPLRMFDVPFGLVGAGMSGANMTEQFIGGARISIIPTGSSLVYIVNNTTGAYSYNLHSTPDIPRTSGTLTPQGTIYQRFIWTTP